LLGLDPAGWAQPPIRPKRWLGLRLASGKEIAGNEIAGKEVASNKLQEAS
jgi:hypothetical protein